MSYLALDFIEFLNQRYGMKDTAPSADSDASAYDAWFKAQVQQAIDDPRPAVPDETVRGDFAARREALRRKAETKA